MELVRLFQVFVFLMVNLFLAMSEILTFLNTIRKTSELNQISKEHTLAAELIAKHGPDAANDMPEHYNHTLTRCLGQDIDFEVDGGEFEAEPGDKILLASDGLLNMVDPSEISKLCASMDCQSLVKELIDQANQNGGVDNTTVVCIDLV